MAQGNKNRGVSMKRLLVLFVVFMIVLSIAGCSPIWREVDEGILSDIDVEQSFGKNTIQVTFDGSRVVVIQDHALIFLNSEGETSPVYYEGEYAYLFQRVGTLTLNSPYYLGQVSLGDLDENKLPY